MPKVFVVKCCGNMKFEEMNTEPSTGNNDEC